jgi:type I restriction enzyme S subunit
MLRSPRLIELYGTLGDGSVHRRRSISFDRFSRIEVPLPPLDEQQRIAAILDKADALCRKRKHSLGLLDSLTQSIFLEMFGDPLANPHGLAVKAIDDLLAVPPNFGSMVPPTAERREWLSLRVANIQNWNLALDDSKYIDLPPQALERHTLTNGDIVLARAIASEEHLGKCVVVYPNKKKWAFDSHLMRIRLNPTKAHPLYVRELFRTQGGRQLFLQSTRKTTVQYNINTKELRALQIPVSGIEQQERFVYKLKSLSQTQQKVEATLQSTSTLFSSLQQRAFSGKL